MERHTNASTISTSSRPPIRLSSLTPRLVVWDHKELRRVLAQFAQLLLLRFVLRSGRCVWVGAATHAGSVRSVSNRGSKDTSHRSVSAVKSSSLRRGDVARHAARAETWRCEERPRRYDRQTLHRYVGRVQGEPGTPHLCTWVCRGFTSVVPLCRSVHPPVTR